MAKEPSELGGAAGAVGGLQFFKVGASGESQFTLLPGSESLRDFAKWVVADFLEALGHRVEIREDLAKLRVRLLD